MENNLKELAYRLENSLASINEQVYAIKDEVLTHSLKADDATEPHCDNTKEPKVTRSTGFVDEGLFDINIPVLGVPDFTIEGASEFTLNCLFLAIFEALAEENGAV